MTVTYRDIKTDILGKITRGDWKPGGLIPSERELTETYGSARATVNRAMRELAEDGIVERKRKSGSRVRLTPLRQARFDIPAIRREVEARGRSYRYALVRSDVTGEPEWLRTRMVLAPGDAVRRLTCLHFADGAPWLHEERWINLGLLPQARDADFAASGPTEWLMAQIPFSAVEISISATAADAALASHLDCPVGDPLLMMERLTRWNDQTVTYVRLIHRPGHRMTTRY